MHLNSDFRELLYLLGRHRVKYVVVGGYAVVHHTQPRYTKDLDVFVEASPKNARRLERALKNSRDHCQNWFWTISRLPGRCS